MNSTAKALLNLQSLEFNADDALETRPQTGGQHTAIKDLRSRVSTQVLREYDSRKRRYGASSVVPIQGEICSGCRVRLSQRTRLLARDHVIQCEHCSRLLYNPSRRRRFLLEV